MATDNPEILLIIPPFGTISDLYLAVPVIVSYLRQHQISVAACDLRRECYAKLLTPQRILHGLSYAQARFQELNARPQLNFAELFEYEQLTAILFAMPKLKREIEPLYYPFADFSTIQNSRAMIFFLQAATIPYFPEMIIPEYSYKELSAYNPFATADILQASAQDNAYTRLFEEIIVEQIVRKSHPRIIGFSVVFTNQIIPTFQCARLIKKYLPETHITLGGPCISTYFREIQTANLFTLVDSLVLDEGEIPLETLVQELSKSQPDLSRVPGLIYQAEQTIHANVPAPSLDLEQSPPPDYTALPLDQYLFTQSRLLAPLRLSKGCFWRQCTFCRTDLPICQNFQQASGEFGYRQLADIVERSGLSTFFFADENADPDVLEDLSLRILRDNLRIRWLAHTRVSKGLTKARCHLYRQAGCIGLRFGIESFSDRILKLMRKGISVKLIQDVLAELKGVVPISAYMMVGFPTETEEEASAGYETLRSFLAQGFIQNYTYAVFCLLYGSDIYKHASHYGISEIHVPDGSDLRVDILDFTSSGMSRPKAFQLQMQFNRGNMLAQCHQVRETIELNGNVAPVRYNVRQIEEILTTHSFTILPFVHWLRDTDVTLHASTALGH